MKYTGSSISKGIAIGEAYLYEPFVPKFTETTVPEEQTNAEIERYNNAKIKAQAELAAIRDKFAQGYADKAKIFTAHLDILFDRAIEKDVIKNICSKFMSADYAVESSYNKFAKLIESSKDELIRERASDIRDVKNRLLRNLYGRAECNLSILAKPVVVFAENLMPSDTATMDRKNVLAIVTETGGETSHTAIIAKSFNIPAILGVKDITSMVKHGETVIVDAVKGEVFTEPDGEQLSFYQNERKNFLKKKEIIEKYFKEEPVMQDGQRIGVHLNIKGSSDDDLKGASDVDGVGLFRTEFLFMERDTPPSEEEQFECYRKVLLAFNDKPVILRTLDIGGDKKVDYLGLPEEDNPFLGNRALRLCLSHPDIFKTQLRAAYRASIYGNLWIMFPMVGSLDELRTAKSVIEEIKIELNSEKKAYSETVKIGVMIEIPSIALIADKVAREVDFASIGTNDLCQYLFAADRMNASVEKYYQSYHPAMFRLMNFISQEFLKQNKTLSVCGELGGDPLAAAVLIGIGITKLSMSISSVAEIKYLISELSGEKAKTIADTVSNLSTNDEVCEYLTKILRKG